jgi:AraC family transcriptional regulator of adaptative response/methylated-DNA-[protein]-cysteine methyltransferase
LVASSDKGVASILIGDDPDGLVRDLQDRFPKARLVGGDKEYESMVVRVVSFVEAPRIGLNLPLDVRGTAFQRRVWQALQDIPVGRTSSYSEIARRIGAPKSVRAVAGACAANNIAVAIPCHRVVRNDGALSGYAWGVERKRELVAREATQAQSQHDDVKAGSSPARDTAKSVCTPFVRRPFSISKQKTEFLPQGIRVNLQSSHEGETKK